MTTDRFPRILFVISIPVALLALAQVMSEDGDIWSRVLHGHRVTPKPLTLSHGIVALVFWSIPTVIALAIIARRKLWHSRLAIGAVACWALFTVYSWTVILVLVFYSR